MAVLLAVVALFYFSIRLPATPCSALILPPLLFVCAYGLNLNRLRERQPDLVEAGPGVPDHGEGVSA